MAEIMEENVFCSIQQVSGVVSCLCKLSESHLLDIIVIVYHVAIHSTELYLHLVQSSIITRMGRVLLCILTFKSLGLFLAPIPRVRAGGAWPLLSDL